MKRLIALILFCLLLAGTIFLLSPGDVEVNNKPQGQEEFGAIAQVDDLNVGRFNHTSTLLNDGQVLVTGGTQDGKAVLRSAEIFDLQDEKWTTVFNMSQARMRHTATVLNSGNVLITGGYAGNGQGHPSLFKHFNGTGNISLDNCEIYDATSGGFTPAQPFHTGRFWHRAVKLQDGRVFVIGGLNISLGALSSCEIYDPEKDLWTEVSPMRQARARFTATLLNNGSVLVTGGHDGREKVPFSSCELYVPEKNIWCEMTSMNRARGYHSAALMADGKVMVSGGFSGQGKPDWSDAEIYDPHSDKWTLAGNTSLPRHNHESVRIHTGEIVIFGGSNCLTGGAHSGIEYHDPDFGEWYDTNLVMLGLKWTRATALGDGSVLICGGMACIEASNATYIYIPPGGDGTERADKPFFTGFNGIISLVLITFFLVAVLYLGLTRGKRGHHRVKREGDRN